MRAGVNEARIFRGEHNSDENVGGKNASKFDAFLIAEQSKAFPSSELNFPNECF